MRWTLLALVVAVTSCGASESTGPFTPLPLPPIDEAALDVRVVALVRVAHPLDPVVARISNRSAEVVYENLCGGELEGFGYVPGEWNASYGFARACLAGGGPPKAPYLRPIEPGSSVVDTFYVNDLAYFGSWRFNFDLQDGDGDLLPRARRISEPFQVSR